MIARSEGAGASTRTRSTTATPARRTTLCSGRRSARWSGRHARAGSRPGASSSRAPSRSPRSAGVHRRPPGAQTRSFAVTYNTYLGRYLFIYLPVPGRPLLAVAPGRVRGRRPLEPAGAGRAGDPGRALRALGDQPRRQAADQPTRVLALLHRLAERRLGPLADLDADPPEDDPGGSAEPLGAARRSGSVVLVEPAPGLAAEMSGDTIRFISGGGAYSGRLNSSNSELQTA